MVNLISGDSDSGRWTRSSRSSRSSRESMLSAEYLKQVVEQLRLEQHTRRMYHEAWVNFNDFLIRLDKWPDTWDNRLVLFVAELMDMSHPSSTISSYVSTVEAVLKEDGS